MPLRQRVQEILTRAVHEIGPRETDWIVEAATARTVDDASRAELAVAMAERRVAGEPLQYILGSQPFRHIELEVGAGVFIPRPETEVLVQHVLDLLPQQGTAVDLCTGSGAIALAVADERPDVEVYATERSPEALDWARKNAVRNGWRERIDERFIHGDLFSGLPPALRGQVDVVIANPPYVATGERDTMPADVVRHEPSEALFAGDDGLEVIRRIAGEAPDWLAPGGWLALEIGATQAAEVAGLLRAAGYEDVDVFGDLAGRARIARARTSAPWAALLPQVRAGEVVAIPTDTVYGVGSILSEGGVGDIFRLKGRPEHKPVAVLVHSLPIAEGLGRFSELARALARSFWPGSLTLVLPRSQGFEVDLGGADRDTVGLRIPGRGDILRFLAASGPLATTSANPSGQPSARTEDQIRSYFPAIPIVSAEPGRGLESTVVSVVRGVEVLREGAISREEIAQVVERSRS